MIFPNAVLNIYICTYIYIGISVSRCGGEPTAAALLGSTLIHSAAVDVVFLLGFFCAVLGSYADADAKLGQDASFALQT